MLYVDILASDISLKMFTSLENFHGFFLFSGPLWTPGSFILPQRSPRYEVNNLHFSINENNILLWFKMKITGKKKVQFKY